MDDDGTVELLLRGTIDGAEVEPTTRQARELLRRPGVTSLVVDLGGVEFIDSLGLGLLVQLRGQADDRGATFVLRSVPPRVDRLLRLTGLLDHLGAE